MRRFHLFELGDFPWLPNVFRNFMTDHLHYADRRLQPFNIVTPKIKSAMQKTGDTQIVDLCSGGAGPLPDLQRHLSDEMNFPVTVTLTDKYPNVNAIDRYKLDERIDYLDESVDATAVPAHIKGFRTNFSAIHHFRPKHVKAILRNAMSSQCGIGIFETTDRSLSTIAKMVLAILIFSFINTPKVGRLTLGRFLLTYLIPIAPLIFMWDACVSVLRSYTVEEFERMAGELDNDGTYKWDVGRVKGTVPTFGDFYVIYVIGYPCTKVK